MKKFITLISIFLGVIFLAGCGQRLVSQTQLIAPTLDEQSNINQVADGGTYKNDKYGFEFNYSGLVISSDSNENNVSLTSEEGGHWLYDIKIENNSDNLTLDKIVAKEEADFNQNNAGSLEDIDYSRTVSDIIIDGKPAKRYSIKKLGDHGNAGAILIIGNNILTIRGDDSSAEAKAGFDGFLSTFKFVK